MNDAIIKYHPAEAEIALLKEKYAGLKADTPEGYEQVRLALREIVPLRTGIEANRQELKAESLARGRAIDAGAKKLTDLLLEIENPLRREKAKVDDAREAAARAIVEAEKARIAELDRAVREAEEAKLRAVREAEQARLNEERRQLAIERSRLKIERELREKENAERFEEKKQWLATKAAEEKAQREAQAKIDIERRRLEDEKLVLERAAREERERKERAEFERLAREQAKLQAQQRTEEMARQAEAQRLAAEAEAKAIEAARPDVERIRNFGEYLDKILPPTLTHKAGTDFVARCTSEIKIIAQRCKAYKFGGGK